MTCFSQDDFNISLIMANNCDKLCGKTTGKKSIKIFY